MRERLIRATAASRERRRFMAVALLIACGMSASVTASQGFVLVSPEEVARERAKGEPPRTRSFLGTDPGAPEIVLLKPLSLSNVTAPTDIELRIMPKSPAKIVWDSLRVLYGFFGLDVTDRLTEHAEVTSAGILARDAVLPAGSHRITIEITDDRQRVGRRTFEFEVRDN